MSKKKILAALSALMMLAGTIPGGMLGAYADEYDADEIAELGEQMWVKAYPSTYGYTVSDPADLPEKPSQTKFDLRDVDEKCYVSSVKDQSIFGTCWAFAAIAAAETSFAYESGYDYNAVDKSQEFDLSERHLAWFSSTPQSAKGMYPSQAGEGFFRLGAEEERASDDPDVVRLYDEIYNGAVPVFATTLFSSFQGPTEEKYAPYLSAQNMICDVYFVDVIKDPATLAKYEIDGFINPETKVRYHCNSKEEFLEAITKEETKGQLSIRGNTGWYQGPGRYWFFQKDSTAIKSLDWSLDESIRYTGQELEHSAILPAICFAAPGTSEYTFSEVGLNAIKNELLRGRGVVLGFFADTSLPEEGVKTDGFINFIDENGNIANNIYDAAYWCHYTYDTQYDPTDPGSVNHVIQGNHAVTVVGYDDDFPKEYFNDPKGLLPGNGAFIVKNSWGTSENYDPWGNNGDGYFYISYYDQSISNLETFDFKFTTKSEAAEKKVVSLYAEMYDLMPAASFARWELPGSAMANVFTAEADLKVYDIGFTNATCNETVEYDVFLLNDGFTDPLDGTLASAKTEKYPYAGYHRVNLDQPVYVRKGQSFSVVAIVICENGSNEVSFKQGSNIKSAMLQLEAQKEAYYEDKGTYDGFVSQNIAYFKGVINKGESFLFANGKWYDWADVTEAAQNCGIGRADQIDYDNFTLQAYTAIEVTNVQHTIDQPSDKPYKPGDKVNCTVTLTSNTIYDTAYDVYVNGSKIGSAEFSTFPETAEFSYVYTVTEEDAARGWFENTASVFMTQQEVYREIELFDEYSNNVIRADAAPAEKEPEPEVKPDPETPKDDSSANPDTGASALPIALIAMALLGAAASRKRR